MGLVRRGILRRPLLLHRHMMADHTAGGRAQDAVMTGIMSGNAADQGALDTAFGVGRIVVAASPSANAQPTTKAFMNANSRGAIRAPPAMWGRRAGKARGGGSLRSAVSLAHPKI